MPQQAPVVVTASSNLLFQGQAIPVDVTITNTGTSTVYLGQSGVTAATGLPLQSGASLELINVTTSLYAAANPATISTPSTTTTAPALLGATALTVTAVTGFTQNMVVTIVDGNNTENVIVGAGSAGTNLVISATTHAHASGVTVGKFVNHNASGVQVHYGA